MMKQLNQLAKQSYIYRFPNQPMSIENKKKVDNLSSVGDPQKVKVLILTEQKTTYADFYFMAKFVNVVKLDLSYNKLSGFPIGFTFKSFPLLRSLFLHYNKFNSLKNLQIISESESIEYLTLFGNPLEQTKTRHFFVNQIPSLKLMDDKIVMMEERNHEIFQFKTRQQTKISFPIVTVLESEGSAYFLSAVIMELKKIRTEYLKANPIIILQRWVRARKLKKEAQRERENSITPPLLTSPSEKGFRDDEKNRLITEKLQISKSSEEKIVSVFKMNFQFISMMKEEAKNQIYALRSYCLEKNINFKPIDRKICQRFPKSKKSQGLAGKSYFQLILKASQQFHIRKIGSNSNTYPLQSSTVIKKLLRKKIQRNKSFQSQISKVTTNLGLQEKIKRLEESYQNNIVLVDQNEKVKFDLIKEAYHKSLKQNNVFPFCLKDVADRVSSAIAIQRVWRGFKVRSKKMNNICKKIEERLAGQFISQWIKSLPFKHRSNYFKEVRSYLRKQGNEFLTIPMSDVIELEANYKRKWLGINFVFKDQKIEPVYNKKMQTIHIFQEDETIYPQYIKDLVEIQTDSNIQTYRSLNHTLTVSDLLFNGAKKIKYFSMSQQAKNQSKEKNNEKIETKMVYFQYSSPQEALKRKFLLSLITYHFQTGQFVRSRDVVPNEQIKNIVETVDENFFVAPVPNANQTKIKEQCDFMTTNLHKDSKQIKLKFFLTNEDLSKNAYIFFPRSLKPTQHLSRQLSYLKSIASSSILQNNEYIDQNSIKGSTKIHKNQIKFESQSISHVDSYQKIHIKEVKKSQRYADHEPDDNKSIIMTRQMAKQRQLEKCRSLQPSKGLKQQSSFELYGHFNTEAVKDSSTLNLRQKIKELELDREIEKQNKKQKINQLKDLHKNRLLENQRYRREELNKIRQKLIDQSAQNNDKIQSQRLEQVLMTARKKKQIQSKLSNSRNLSESFEKDFMKRGNSSMRREMHRFESAKKNYKISPHLSINESQNSLALHRNSLLNPSKKIFNLKTDIKEFSIQVSEEDADINLINYEIQSYTKKKQALKNKRMCEKSKQIQKDESPITNRERVQEIKETRARAGSKKSKIVHSVFPEQFYPLAEKSMGFRLPNISRK